MEEKVVQVREFVCKYCQKRCFNGKSLGGHMRSHLALISAAKDNNNENKAKAETDMTCENGADDLLGIEENNNNGCRSRSSRSSSSSSSSKVSAEQEETPKTSLIQEKMDELMISVGIGSDDQDQDSYDLRENPKKSWKISDHVRAVAGDPIPKKVSYLCKECEKSFPSSRALSGHMRAHTVKGKKNGHICKKCSKGFESARALYGHLKSHSKRPRLSSSTTTTKSEFDVDYPRKKRSVIRYNNLMTPTNASLSTANASSSAAAAFDFDDEVEDAAVCLMLLSRGTTDLADSIDTNEAVESKPFPLSQSETRSRGISADEEKNPPAKKTDSSSSLVSESDEINEFEKHNNYDDDDDAKEAEIELEKATKIAKASDSSDSTQVEEVEAPPEKDLKLAALGTGTRRGSDEDDSDKNSGVVVVVSEMLLKDDGKKRGYKCRSCNMIFSSHQALGGHRNRHKVIRRSSAAMVNESRNGVLLSENNEYCYYYYYNNKYQNQNQKHQHECAVCLKVFPTGQALGGHKRAHYAGFTESRTKENTTVVRNHQQEEEEEEESTADDLWWTTTEHGLVINQVTHCCSLSN